MAGDQVPVMLLVEVVGKAASVAPVQMGATCVKVGTVPLMVMVKEATSIHCVVLVGVKV